MITIMKTYNSPMLNVVSINKRDIIATSTDAPLSNTTQDNGAALGAGLRGLFDPYDNSWDTGF